MARYGIVTVYARVQYDVFWYSMVGFCMVWYVTVWYVTVWYVRVWYGLMVWYMVWSLG